MSAARLVCATLFAGGAMIACDQDTPAPRQPTLPDGFGLGDPDAATGPRADAAADDGGTDDAAAPPEREGWRLVWSDEFDAPADTPPDPTWWVHDVGGDGWGNEQLEYDTDRVENSAHDGSGNLVITARREAFGGRDYTSARIKTQGRFAQRYGRFEARIQLPRGAGMWPAFWMLGEDIGQVGWPTCGEIDIMEFRGQQVRQSTGAVHGPGYSAGNARSGVYNAGVALPDGFHEFAVEWAPEEITWFVDDQRFMRVTPNNLPLGAAWVFDDPFFLILNLAVGGTYVGPPDASTEFPQRLRVDYVRVYEADP